MPGRGAGRAALSSGRTGIYLLDMSLSPVGEHSRARQTMEGAGVRLHRAFGFGDTEQTDPFLLFDDFRGDREDDYIRGFPWHPHRGIEKT